MPFMVIYSTADGSSCYEQSDAIDEAALFVERLRNKEGIDQVRIYRMEEISFAFRPYYKVELGLPERQDTAVSSDVIGARATVKVDKTPTADAPPEDEPSAERVATVNADVPLPLPAAPGDGEPAGANGRRGLFGR